VESNGFGWTGVVSQTSSLAWEKYVEPFQLLGAVSDQRLLLGMYSLRRRVQVVLLKDPFTRVEHSVPNISYFKSAGVREIQFPGIVKASLQLEKTF
jgi:hypothetical protein